MDQDPRPVKMDKARARRYGRRVLAVRAMAGETAWLDGRIVWHDGRMGWETDRGVVVPDAATIALAQRRLAQIGGYPRSSSKAFGDAQAWLAARLAKMELAKRLQGISERDMVGLAEEVRARDERAIARMAALLSAEAYCANVLPVSPGETLVTCGGKVAGVLREMTADREVPEAGRALAAMALGAVERRRPDGDGRKVTEQGWNARAYAWGMTHGWPQDAPVVLWLLAEGGGTGLAERLVKIERDRGRYLPASEDLRGLLMRGVDGNRVIELCEACAAMEPVAVRIMHYRDKLEGVALQWRQEAAAQLQDERLPLVGEMIELVRKYAISTLDAGVVYDLARFAGMMLDLGNHPVELAESALVVMRRGLEMPVGMRGAFLELLIERFGSIWKAEDVAEAAGKGPEGLTKWRSYWNRETVYPLSSLLVETNDVALVREALERNLAPLIYYYHWKDVELYRYFLSVARRLDIIKWAWRLADVLNELRSVKSARAVLDPLMPALLGVRDAEIRGPIAGAIFDGLRFQKTPARVLAGRLAQYVPRIARFMSGPGVESRFGWRAVASAVRLYEEVGEDAGAWLDRLLGYLEQMGRRGELEEMQYQTLRSALPFVVTLAGGDGERFSALVRAAMAHSFDYDDEQIEKSVPVLKRFPMLRDALARIFPLQPHRCVGLAVKMGFVSRLGEGASAPLGYLEARGADEALPEEWRKLVEMVPGAERDARAFVMSRYILGEGAEIPPGALKALEQPSKLEKELVFLEEKMRGGEHAAGIGVRVENLRARLADESKLMREVRSEVEEKIAHISAEAQIATAEAKMKECYRVRLQKLAGALPSDLEMSDDLVNATLLTADIESNRKLLLKLLKAYLKGDKRWPEHHPANVKFLADLANKGVNVEAWLGVNPRRYVCAGVAGGKVRLVLERDPLGVLQMGNYFDTCLSFGQFNSFSTVANACELNKRVVYGYDGAGRVVGRKLIGINAEGKMVGFHTYSTLGEDEGKALRAIFTRYCTEFAARCGLEMSDDGSVPKLFAERWYDDGTVKWGDDEARPTSARSGAGAGMPASNVMAGAARSGER